MRKKKIIILLICFIIILFLLFTFNNSLNTLGYKYFDIAISDYQNDNYKYKTDKNGNYIIYYYNDTDYYNVTNMNKILANYTLNNQKNFLTDIGAINEKGKYYVPVESLNYLNNNYGNNLSINKISLNEIIYTVSSVYCITDNNDDDNEDNRCLNYKKRKTKFIIKKEDNNWKIKYFKFPTN